MTDKIQTTELNQDGTAAHGNADWEVFSEANAADAIEASLEVTDAFGGNPATTADALVADRSAGDTVPGAPTAPVGTGGDAQVSVAFVAPASTGGRPITSYTVTSTPGGFTSTGASSPRVVTGLTNGTAYTFKVKATNSVGTGPESVASAPVTPSA